MEIIFSRHAKRQMSWRGITEEEVKLTLSDYDKIEGSVKGRRNAFKKIGTRLIKVTFREEDDKITVITTLERK
ncbi:MAG: DUF4258 domain-containing protein [candidate division Zixibacteria bacterium]|nr:DUF4258 domain-containing protein [candidate division Zixibacteria bacterium]